MSTSQMLIAEQLSAVGIMDKAFFASKNELINWLKNDFQLNLKEIEQCANGCVYLQIVDKLFPGCVPMGKVKWCSKLEHENVGNYKLLQAALAKGGIKKNIEVEKVIRGKYQDNLELLQWMKGLYDRYDGRSRPYDPARRRLLGVGPLPDWAKGPTTVTNSNEGVSGSSSSQVSKKHQRLPSSAESKSANMIQQQKTPINKKTASLLRSTNSRPPTSKAAAEVTAELRHDGVETSEKLKRVQCERNFYFNKLIATEIIAKRCEEERKALRIEWQFAILYTRDLLDPQSLIECPLGIEMSKLLQVEKYRHDRNDDTNNN